MRQFYFICFISMSLNYSSHIIVFSPSYLWFYWILSYLEALFYSWRTSSILSVFGLVDIIIRFKGGHMVNTCQTHICHMLSTCTTVHCCAMLCARLATVWSMNPMNLVRTWTGPEVQVQVRPWGWTEPPLQVQVCCLIKSGEPLQPYWWWSWTVNRVQMGLLTDACTVPTPAKPVPITGVCLCRLCSAKPQDGGPQGNYIIKGYINILVTDWNLYNWCFMSMYSVLDSTRLWAGICPDEAECPQAYSCGESLPIYVLNNVGISREAYTPRLCWNKLILGCFCVFRGAWCRNTTSDVQAWAWGSKPAQAGPGKPSWAQAECMAWEGLGLRLQILKAQATGLSPVYIEFFYDR